MAHAAEGGLRAARWTPAAVLTATLSGLIACGGGNQIVAPTSPTGMELLLVDCTPFNDGLRCAARVTDATGRTGDVTSDATWSVSPPGAAIVPQAGLLVPVSPTDVTVTVSYGSLRNSNPLEYRVAPGAPPKPLTFLGVSALDDSRAPIFRASVEIVSGTGAGQSCLTNETGYCSMRGVLLGEPLRVRVSAEGYVPVERDHRIEPFPGTPFLTVLLANAPG